MGLRIKPYSWKTGERRNRDPVHPIDFAFLKNRYDFELQRKEQLTGRT